MIYMPPKQARTIYFSKDRLEWIEKESKCTGKPLSKIIGDCIDARRGIKSADESLVRSIVHEEIARHREESMRQMNELILKYGLNDMQQDVKKLETEVKERKKKKHDGSFSSSSTRTSHAGESAIVQRL